MTDRMTEQDLDDAEALCEAGHHGKQPPRGEWKLYETEAFHRETLRNCKIGDRS